MTSFIINPFTGDLIPSTPGGGTPGGSTTQVQFNNAGAFAGISTLTYDGTTLTTSGRFVNSYNATASTPAKSFTGTWFTGGTGTTTKPQVLIEPTGATSTNWSTSGTGLGVNAASGFTGNLLDLQVNGTSNFAVQTGVAYTLDSSYGLRRNSNAVTAITGGSTGQNIIDLAATFVQLNAIRLDRSNQDLVILRDAAGTLAQRNGTAAQTFRVYNTFTDASNYERHTNSWSGNVLNIANEAAGTGTLRSIAFSANAAASTPPVAFTGTWFTSGTATTTKPQVLVEPTGATSTAWSTSGTGLGVNAASGFAGNLLDLQVNGTSRFSVSNTGAIIQAGTPSTRGALFSGYIESSAGYYIVGKSGWTSPVDGNVRLSNSIENNFGLLQLGGTSSSFPALKRNSAVLETKLADDSAYAQHAASVFQTATAHTVATLPGTPAVGMIARVTNATAPVVGTTVAGGGAAAALVWYNGANWSVIGV